jgi:photosystem II stability/assembly factor-like uncharacterized protein
MNKRFFANLLILFTLLFLLFPAHGAENDSLFTTQNFSGLKFRSIGPAFMSGRIADIAIHPEDQSIWYIAVGSGNVWKTENAGITFTPIFENEGSYSIGCVAIDPGNPNTVWVGTGENVGGRHVGFGDGIYRSDNGGKSWQNMGLNHSEHISKIIIHPENSDVIFVATQGPLWSAGGERGFYKSTDGGLTWRKMLGDNEWTGVTDIATDPRNPDRIYAATWQRHRNVAAYMGGGPNTAIYRSEDAGETWKKISNGLPVGNMGKTGIAISPQQPDVIYAAIELERRTGGVFRSEDRGETWTKMSDVVAGGTGPHYYQELYACPHNFDRIYLMDVRIRISNNGGRSFRRMNTTDKHVDNHAIAFRKDDPDYLLVGTDGGLYESFDLAANWRHFGNLPLTQFYKVAVDDDFPFYNVYGGTQDNNTQGGPSRTDNRHGIRNSDWFIPLFADGHQPATEPGNPDIVYAQWQQGNLCRTDRTTGEVVFIKPQPAENEPPERYNWDAPILVSPHQPATIFFGSQRVWRSDNRGDSWKAISPDLTKNQERMELPIMGRQQSWDNAWDFVAMSDYNTITSLAQSPVDEMIFWAGTDDGLIQVTENGGESWRAVEVGKLPGVPSTAFVNDIKADLYDANTVYIALDNHKFGDFKPYLYKSSNLGKSWRSITGDIPDRHLVWRIVQDHVKPELFFAATEFGIFFTIDGGDKWVQLNGGLPVISFRDLAIQRRENDLVGASFGRSFYILDDYTPLRHISENTLQQEAVLLPARKAWWYIERPVIGFGERGTMGSDHFQAPNPPFGAVFTIYLSEGLQSQEEKRKAAEAKITQQDIPFPGWDTLDEELRSDNPQIILTITNSEGETIRRLPCPVAKGFHRIAWDLKISEQSAINYYKVPSDAFSGGMMAAPGKYTAGLFKVINGVVTQLSQPVTFEVEKLRSGKLQSATPDDVAAFWYELGELNQAIGAMNITLDNVQKYVEAMQVALNRSKINYDQIAPELARLKMELNEFDRQLNGNLAKRKVGEKKLMTISDRLNVARMGTNNSTYGPTQMHLENVEIAKSQFNKLRDELETMQDERIPEIEQKLIEAGAPWMPNQKIPSGK